MQERGPGIDFSGLEIRDGSGFCILKVRITPKASKNEIQGVGEGALRLRIQAPPIEGAANDMTRDFLAELLNCPRKLIRIERGLTNRSKAFRIDTLTSNEVRTALTNRLVQR